jgi:hypothetical protein
MHTIIVSTKQVNEIRLKPKIIKRANNIFNYFYIGLAVYMIALMVNYYFNLAELHFNLILSSIVILGLLSITITVWYKIELRESFEKTTTQIFQYKNSKIIWSAVGIGVMAILIAKNADSEVKI